MGDTEGSLFFGGTEALDAYDEDYEFHNGDRTNHDSPAAGAYDSDGTEVPYDREATSKRRRISDGTVRKPITDKFDKYDERLFELKMQNFSNKYIAEKLVEEGGPQYTVVAIPSRFTRLRLKKEQLENDKLDDELSDWHVGEDELLEEVIESLKEKYEREHQKVEDKRWKEISEKMAEKLEVKKYTAKACHERWTGRQDGTALMPIELDSDQEGRRIMREERVAASKKARADAKAAVQAVIDAENEKKRIKEERSEAAAKQKEEEKLARAALKAENANLVAEKRRATKEEQAGKKEAKALWMHAIHETRKTRELEERIYRNITGKQLNRLRHSTKTGGADYEDGGSELDSDENNEDDEGYITDNELAAEADEENNPADMQDITSDREEDKCASDISSENGAPAAAPPPAPTKAKVTAATLANPRSVLTDAELEVLIFERGLAKRTNRETHPQVVARLAAADEALSVDQLNELLGKHFDHRKGNKATKLERLAEHDALNSAAGEAGVYSTDLEFKKRYEGYTDKFAALLR